MTFVMSTWECMECVWSVERPSKAMYEALTENRSKAVLYVCSLYHKQDSMSKHLFKFEMEYECTCKERLASACMLDEVHNQLQRAEA